MFNFFRKKAQKTLITRKYYREYMMQCGWGVMLGYDTVMAINPTQAWKMPARSIYGDGMEGVWPIKAEHLDLSDCELSRLYGHQIED